MTALLGARLYGGAAGLHGGFVLATALLPFAYGRAASMDMLLAATVTTGIGLLGLSALGIAGRLAVPAAFAAIGLATLAKGPLGLLLPGLVAAGYLLVARDGRFLRALVSPLGIALFLLVAGPWYVAILRDQGRHFVDVFLLNHNVARFTSTIHNHPGPPVYYVPVILAGLFPWSGLLLPALARLRPRVDRTDLFVFLWFLLPFLFFSVAGSKLPGYILPCLPPLALLMGRAAAALVAEEPAPRWWAGPRAVALVSLVLGALFATAPAVLRFSLQDPDWALAIPFGLWCVIVALGFSRQVAESPATALRLLRVGGAGALLLLALAAPADPRPARVGPAAVRSRHGPRGAGLGGLANRLDGRLLLQRRARPAGRRNRRDPGVGRQGAHAGGRGTGRAAAAREHSGLRGLPPGRGTARQRPVEAGAPVSLP